MPAQIGAERTAIKINPGITFSDLMEPETDVRETLAYLGPQLERRRLAYVCVMNTNQGGPPVGRRGNRARVSEGSGWRDGSRSTCAS